MLGLSYAAFTKRHRVLREQHAFPLPLKGLGHRWDPEAIAAWITCQRHAEPAAQQANDDDDEWGRTLDKRAAQLAGLR